MSSGHTTHTREDLRRLRKARLEEAATAPRAALEERTREKAPLDWATIQNNLRATLHALGQREREGILGRVRDHSPRTT